MGAQESIRQFFKGSKVSLYIVVEMQRPLWTCAFMNIWLLAIPGALLTHYAVIILAPAVADLPENIIKGFDEVFRFAYLQQDSTDVRTSAETAIRQCTTESAGTLCQDESKIAALTGSMIAYDSKVAIKKSFANSLAVVNKVANDKFFGSDGMKATADSLNAITAEMDKIPETSPCSVGTASFCKIRDASDEIVKGMDEVNAAIDEFKNAEVVKQWGDNADYCVGLHGLPYLLVIALLFFSFFWWKGGLCCCCRDGSCCGCLALFPFLIFWLVAFLIYGIVLGAGVALRVYEDVVTVPVLKGEPTLAEAAEWIQVEYSGFWDLVFADLVEGLEWLFRASWFIVLCALLLVIYGMCECCCCPYRVVAARGDKNADAEKVGLEGGSAAEDNPEREMDPIDFFDWSIPKSEKFLGGLPQTFAIQITHGHFAFENEKEFESI